MKNLGINIFTQLLLLLLLLFSQSANAITNGSSIGVSIGKSTNSFDAGVFYKYNWNINRIILAVELYYDHLNETNFKHSYGANINLGYDILKKTAIYGILGFGKMENYRSNVGFGVAQDLSISWKTAVEYIRNDNINNIKLLIMYKF